MGKKSLEQLFKEVFKDFTESPDDKVWKSIEASLDKKERKRVIPIWWRLGGVAALLAILFYVVNPFGKSDVDTDVILTDTQNESVLPENNTTSEEVEPSEVFSNPDSEQLVDSAIEEDSKSKESRSTQDSNKSMLQNESLGSDQQLVTSPNKIDGNTKKESNIVPESKQEVAAVDTPSHTPVEKDAVVVSDAVTGIKDAEVEKRDTPSENGENKNNLQKEEKLFEVPSEENAVAQNNIDGQKTDKDPEAQEKESIPDSEKKSIFEVIKEQEEEAIAENSSAKWSVGPSVAPVYFNATGNGSPIHSNFAANSKSGNVNLSYGLTVAYELGKKLKVRSGVHRVNYGYDTNEVIFSSSLEASSSDLIENIDYSQTSRTVVVQSKNRAPEAALANDAVLELAANETPALDGKMVQQLGYIEVPLELDYALIDKKFGVNIIGGVSSLFLVDNSVLLESDDLVTEVGEANNANEVNFSTNVGIGLNYEFTPKVQLNVEPVFKYQLNTFSQTAGSFRPFSVGVYSGVRFKF